MVTLPNENDWKILEWYEQLQTYQNLKLKKKPKKNNNNNKQTNKQKQANFNLMLLVIQPILVRYLKISWDSILQIDGNIL